MQEILHYFFNVKYMWLAMPALMKGLVVTLQIASVTIVGGVALGLLLAVVRSFRLRAVNVGIILFIDVFRALPPLVVLVLIFFALPAAGIVLPPFWCASLALVLVLAAVAEEIFWAGMISVDRGQWEAARSTGVSFLVTLLWIIVPQGIRLVIPPLTNKVISITKNTALASVVAEPELLNQAMTMQGVYANPSPLMAGAILYVLIFLPFVLFSRWLERRTGYVM